MRAAVLVAGALMMGAAPAFAATAEPASEAALTTSTLQAPRMTEPPTCIGQEMVLSWSGVPGASGYRVFADGAWVYGTTETYAIFYGWDPDIMWSVRAVDELGNVSPESNRVRGGCQGAG